MAKDLKSKPHGTIETGQAELPAPTPAPKTLRARSLQRPALSPEAVQKRQDAFGTRRKEGRPPLAAETAARALSRAADVPETHVIEAPHADKAGKRSKN